ncbi:MAG: serine/threonine protein kinase [Myxococcales bacterium]|nr:serine/threonine protein kinase [Myxococcales bacterium]
MAIDERTLTDFEDLLGPRLFAAEINQSPPLVLAGRYRLEAPVGRGARGLVLRAHDVTLKRSVALKLYPHHDPALVDEALSEAQVLAQLRHRNIVLVHDIGAAELDLGGRSVPCLFIVMEYVEGTHLRAWIANQSPTPGEIMDAFLAAGEGLAAAHAAGILHRDVKPANIVLDHETARMIDFGLARSLLPEDRVDARATSYGFACGTLAYMAPEARRGHSDVRTDLFAFAVSLWEGLTGELPFDPEAGEWRLGHHADFFGAERLPRSIAVILRRALSHNPNDRQVSMRILLDELRGRRDDLNPSRLAGALTSILKSPVVSRFRRFLEQPAEGMTATWAERARQVQDEAQTQAEAAERRASAREPKRIPSGTPPEQGE